MGRLIELLSYEYNRKYTNTNTLFFKCCVKLADFQAISLDSSDFEFPAQFTGPKLGCYFLYKLNKVSGVANGP